MIEAHGDALRLRESRVSCEFVRNPFLLNDGCLAAFALGSDFKTGCMRVIGRSFVKGPRFRRYIFPTSPLNAAISRSFVNDL